MTAHQTGTPPPRAYLRHLLQRTGCYCGPIAVAYKEQLKWWVWQLLEYIVTHCYQVLWVCLWCCQHVEQVKVALGN